MSRPPRRSGLPGWLDESEQELRRSGQELIPYGGYGPTPMPFPQYGQSPYYLPLPFQPFVQPQWQPNTGTGYAGATGPKPESVHPTGKLHDLLKKKGVAGICSELTGDLTVHLDFDIEEDLEEDFEELSHLSRIGHFTEARQFFDENLELHMGRPYVLVQYADMLLQQGDYKAVTKLEGDAFYKLANDMPESSEVKLLQWNWELIQIFAKTYTSEHHHRYLTVVFEGSINILVDLAQDPDRTITTTEIKTFGLLLHLTAHPNLHGKYSRYKEEILQSLPKNYYQHLYSCLLSQGRIWDLHDLITLMPSIKDLEILMQDLLRSPTIQDGMQMLISDWSGSVDEYDAPTTQAFLSIAAFIMMELVQSSEQDALVDALLKQALPLAQETAGRDPEGMRTRPYLRILLAKLRFAEQRGPDETASLLARLQDSPGLAYHADRRVLPVYVPHGSENPGWSVRDAASTLRESIEMIAKSARNLGDYTTEAMALLGATRLNSNPRDEFDRLCILQKLYQHDMRAYASTIASKYLVSDTEESRKKLSQEIGQLLSRIEPTEYFNSNQHWVLNILLLKLNNSSGLAIDAALENTSADYHDMDSVFLDAIYRKFPGLINWAEQQMLKAKQMKKEASHQVQLGRQKGKTRRRGNTEAPGHSKAARSEKGDEKERHVGFESTADEKGDTSSMLAKRVSPPPEASRSRERAMPPPAPPVAPRPHSPDDPEKNELRKKLAQLERARERETSEASQKEMERRIREETEAALREKMERFQEQSRMQEKQREMIEENTRMEIQLARREAELTVREAVESEKRAQNERRRLEVETAACVEKERMEAERKMEIERKAEERLRAMEKEAATAKAALEREKLEAVRRNTEETEARIKTMMEEERQKRLREEAARSTEVEVRRKLETEFAAREKKEEERRAAEIERARREAAAATAAKEALEATNSTEKAPQEVREKEKEEQEPISFTDSLGRKFSFPFPTCSTRQGMDSMIQQAFRRVSDLDMINQVDNGRYDLLGSDGEIILPLVWDSIIKPGATISMQMWPIVERPQQRHPGIHPPLRPGIPSRRGPPPPPGFRAAFPPPAIPGPSRMPPPPRQKRGPPRNPPDSEEDNTKDSEDESDDESSNGSEARAWWGARKADLLGHRIRNTFSGLKRKLRGKPSPSQIGSVTETSTTSSDELVNR